MYTAPRPSPPSLLHRGEWRPGLREFQDTRAGRLLGLTRRGIFFGGVGRGWKMMFLAWLDAASGCVLMAL